MRTTWGTRFRFLFRAIGLTGVLAVAVGAALTATAFPSGQSPLETMLEEDRWVVEHGADEVDMVIDRGSFLAGR